MPAIWPRSSWAAARSAARAIAARVAKAVTNTSGRRASILHLLKVLQGRSRSALGGDEIITFRPLTQGQLHRHLRAGPLDPKGPTHRSAPTHLVGADLCPYTPRGGGCTPTHLVAADLCPYTPRGGGPVPLHTSWGRTCVSARMSDEPTCGGGPMLGYIRRMTTQ